ncbi:hypothetical protein niasHS_009863 [Heterodera schachtii]|uniref:Uncharacterized protein n=1 Tax=Heterodera schachtii TaxID=97005 RepID=A0ABD2JAL7_HETSC
MTEVLCNRAHVLDEENGQQPEEGKQSTDSWSTMNTFFMYFEMNLSPSLRREREKIGKSASDTQITVLVLNNAFEGIDGETLLEFDIKGTFAPGSAVQHDQKQKWYTGAKDWQNSLYREYDFIGISREGIENQLIFKINLYKIQSAYSTLCLLK